MATTLRRKSTATLPVPQAAEIYRVIFTFKDGREKPWGRLLQPGEVDDCLALFNRYTKFNGTSARAVPMRLVPVVEGGVA